MEEAVETKQVEVKKKHKRIWELDFVRGVLIIGMLIDHFFCNIATTVSGFWKPEQLPTWLNQMTQFGTEYWFNNWKILVRFIGVILFFFLIGISSRFSRSNVKRGLICTGLGVGWALIMFGVSKIANIWWYSLCPILLVLGLAMLSYAGLQALFLKVFKIKPENWKWWALGLGSAIVLGGFIMNSCLRDYANKPIEFGNFFLGLFGEYNPVWNDMQRNLQPYEIPLIYIGAFRWGSDWIGTIPFIGFTLLGGFFGEHVYKERKSIFFRKDPEKNESFNEKATKATRPINWLGKKTMWIYLFHQVLLIPIVFLIYWIGSGVWPF